MRLVERQMGYNIINNMQQVVSRAHGRSLARRNGDRKCSAPLADGLRHSIAEVHFHPFSTQGKAPPWRRGRLSRDQACAVVAPAQHAPEPLPQRAVCARSPGTARATAVREVHSLIDQRVRNDVELPVDVIHRPMDAPLRERVAELGACAEVRPQARGAASGLPAAEDDDLARDQLRIQLEDYPAVRVGVPQRALHARLKPYVFGHVAGVPLVQNPVRCAGGGSSPGCADNPKNRRPPNTRRANMATPSVLAVEHGVLRVRRWL